MTEPRILRIDISSPVPAYRQIAAGVRAMLVAGRFRPGEVLPTIRQLAMDLGVHPNTVAEGYRLLAEEGWLDLRRRRGATVLRRDAPEPVPEATASYARRIEELVAEALAAGVPQNEVANRLSELAAELGREGKTP
jgi:DNA-binding transcriptional regulator YhcF (GntR family)